MPKIFLNKRTDKIPQVGDLYEVKGVYPNTTDDLWRPKVEVYVELVKKPDEKDKEAGR
jgi:hypothetical protein